MRHQEKEELHKISQDLAEKLKAAGAGGEVKMRGPMPCAIGRIAGFERSQILLSCERVEPLQKVLHGLREAGGLSKAEAVAVDVDPVSVL